MAKKKAPILQATHTASVTDDSFARFLRGDKSMLQCTLCGKAGGCSCWSKCVACGWMFDSRKSCRNCVDTTNVLSKEE